MRKQLALVSLAALLVASPAVAAAANFGDGFGINVKNERITESELKDIASIGIKRVRVSISWYAVEQAKGQYRWDINLPRRSDADDYATRKEFTYDWLFGAITKAGLKADVTLHEGNAGLLGLVNIAPAGQEPQWRHVAPHTDADIDLFAGFAGASVKHMAKLYGRDKFSWHIWNEPDTDAGYPPKTDGATIGKLLTKSCEAIRRVDRKAVVMGPALGAYGDGDLRYDFMRAMFTQSNPLTCLDGLTVHPYRSAVPETAPVDYTKVSQVMAPFQTLSPTAVGVDEWGYSIDQHPNGVPATQKWRTFTEEEQAALMLRMYLTNLQAGVPLTVLYEWRNSCTSATDWECHFGAVGHDGKDKAAAKMFRFVWPTLMSRPLVWAQQVNKCSAGERLQRYSTRGDGTSWTVVWSTSTTPVPVVIEGQILKIVDIFGKDAPNKVLTGSPLMIQHVTGNLPKVSCQ